MGEVRLLQDNEELNDGLGRPNPMCENQAPVWRQEKSIVGCLQTSDQAPLSFA